MTSAPGTGRFPRSARLRSKAEFQRVFRTGFKSADRCFTVLATENDLHHPRLGLAISKKVAPSAVARNRIKRVVRDSFRLNQHRLPPLDIVVLARQGLNRREKREMHAALNKHWSRLIERCDES